MIKLNSKQLRDIPEEEASQHSSGVERNPIFLIVENVYDTYNIGGLFRLADALAVEKIYLCGEMETPPHHKIEKASVGTYKIVPWEYKETAVEAIDELRKLDVGDWKLDKKQSNVKHPTSNIKIIAIEQSEHSVPYTEIEYTAPVAFLVGNETFGVLPETLAAVDHIVEIPMWGINKSLNVIVSAGIVAYFAINQLEMRNLK
ncbi:hypothetical protein KBD81_03285 [Candidatus Woesebacteria bacterium]|nr:hypothetical protein [Candidatus Woesebacteria bacterium]